MTVHLQNRGHQGHTLHSIDKLRCKIIFSASFVTLQATARSAPDRESEIAQLVKKAQFNNDPYVQEFGIKVSMMLVRFRLIGSNFRYLLTVIRCIIGCFMISPLCRLFERLPILLIGFSTLITNLAFFCIMTSSSWCPVRLLRHFLLFLLVS